MRGFKNNNSGVSNVIGYMFTFSISTMVMVSAIFITNTIIENKKNEVATIEAQNIANYVANALAEAISVRQSMPDATYQKEWDIPTKIAGKDYSIEITQTEVIVSTSDGHVSKSASTYVPEGVDVGITNGIVNTNQGKITISYEKSAYLYKFDFGQVISSTSHTPVEAGYIMASNQTEPNPSDWDSLSQPYRIPIIVNNPSSDRLNEVPVKIVLNESNFDYDKAIVTPYTSTDSEWSTSRETESDSITPKTANSNIEFVDPDPSSRIELISFINPQVWYRHWQWSIKQGYDGAPKHTFNVTITFTDVNGPNSTYILWDEAHPLTLSAGSGTPARCFNLTRNVLVGAAEFYIEDAFATIPSSLISDGQAITFIVRGYYKDLTEFSSTCSITMKFGDIYVDDVAGTSGPNNPPEDYTDIKTAVNSVPAGSTIYVYGGTYFIGGSGKITIDKKINLTGEVDSSGQWKTIVDGWVSTEYVIKIVGPPGIGGSGSIISSLNIYNASQYFFGSLTYSIYLNGCSGVEITNCKISDTTGPGIYMDGSSQYNIIYYCESIKNDGQWRVGNYYSEGRGLEINGPSCKYNLVVKSTFSDNGGVSSGTPHYEKCDGIRITNYAQYNRILGCTISGNDGVYTDGIEFYEGSKYNEIIDCNITGQTGDQSDAIAIWAPILGPYTTSDNLVKGCTMYNNYGGGITVICSDRNTVIDCKIYENLVGIYIYGSDNNIIKNCDTYSNILNTSKECKILSYTVFFGDGIYLDENSDNNTIDGCNIHENNGDGVHIDQSSPYPVPNIGNIVQNCDIWENGCNSCGGRARHGIYLEQAVNTTIRYCNITSSKSDGIHITNTQKNVNYDKYNNIYSNNIINNRDDGIDLDEYAWKNLIYNNNIYDNWWAGVYIAGFVVSTKNPYKNYITYNNFFNNKTHVHPSSCPGVTVYLDAVDDTDFGAGDLNYWDDFLTDGNYWGNYVQCSVPGSGDPIYNVPNYYRPSDSNDNDDHARKNTFGGPFSNPDIIMVDDDQSANWYSQNYHCTNDLSWAVNNVLPGGTIKVCPGTYTISASLEIKKSLKIVANDTQNKPIIKVNGAFPAINITNRNTSVAGGGTLEIIIDSIKISGNNKQGTDGIRVNAKNSYTSDVVKIRNCEIYSFKENGINLSSSRNSVDGCIIRDNSINGLIINGTDYNSITNSHFYKNQNGINITRNLTSTPNDNVIQYCTFNDNSQGSSYKNQNGINIANSANSGCPVTISFCTFSNNTNGTLIQEDSNNATIKNCTYKDNTNYGIYIKGAIADNNDIYWNVFSGNGVQDAYDETPSASRTYWDHASKGNYWSTYLGTDSNYDGIGDTPYSVPPVTTGNQKDNFPLGSQRLGGIFRKYSIEYWNPSGESIFLVRLSMYPNEQEKVIYLYYGSDSTKQIGLGDTSELFKTSSALQNQGTYNPGQKQYLYNVPSFSIPLIQENNHTKVEKMYVVEAKLKLNTENNDTTQSNLMLLGDASTNNYYTTVYDDINTTNRLFYHKKEAGSFKNEKNDTVPENLDNWLRVQSYVYISKNCYKVGAVAKYTNFTKVTSFVYDYKSLVNLGNLSVREDTVYGTPYLDGWMGVGCGLIATSVMGGSSETPEPQRPRGSITVDWFRVRKAPIIPPEVIVGSMETINYHWAAGLWSGDNSNSDNAFLPGPILRDYVNSSGNALLIIDKGLEKGALTITVTAGVYNKPYEGFTMDIKGNGQNYGSLTFSGSVDINGGFETKSITVDWPYEDTPMNLEFIKPAASLPQNIWYLNALTIESGVKGLNVLEG